MADARASVADGMHPLRLAFVRSLRLVARLLQAAASFFTYLAAGAFRREDIERSILAEWDEFGQCPLAAQIGLQHWEREFYGRFTRAGDRVLLVGCGTGRDLLPLLEDGFDVEGIDLVPSAIEACAQTLKKRGFVAKLHVGPIESATLGSRFDTIIFSWWCYGYLPGREARAQALENVRRHLTSGGQALLSYTTWAEGAPRPPLWLTRLSCALLGTGWKPEPGDAIWLLGGWREPLLHFEHRFTADEIEREARQAGFSVVFHETGTEGRMVLTVSPDAVTSSARDAQPMAARTDSTAEASATKASS